MAHANQERWATLVDAKLRNQLVTRDNLIFNSRYEGDPTSGKVKIPVRDTEAAVKEYDKANGSLALSIDKKSIAALEGATGATISATKTAATESNAYKLALEAKRVLGRKGVPADGRFLIASPEYLEVLMLDEHYIKQGDLSQELVQQGVVGRIAGFNVFESNNMDYESTTRVTSKKTTTEFIAGHPNWCHRVMEWQVAIHLQDLSGSGKYIGASAVQGRKVYGLKVSKPQTLYIKRTEV